MDNPIVNKLYLAVFPQIAVSGSSFGRTEQILTLVPDKNTATAFFPDEVDTYIRVFRNRESHLIGGHVIGYELEKEMSNDGRTYIQVKQNVR